MSDRPFPPRPGRLGLALLCLLAWSAGVGRARPAGPDPFARDNLVAWCVVPFDAKHRGPAERAAMLKRLGFARFAYDWRAEHVAGFDAELDALKREGIALTAFWLATGELNDDSRRILDLFARHKVRPDLWAALDLGADLATGAESARRVEVAASKLGPLARAAARVGCRVGLYNHGGWFGEPENQLAIIDRLERDGVTNVGIVYNLHHAHHQVDRLGPILAKIGRRLYALNLNGMDRDGDRTARKILPIGQGECDLAILEIIRASGDVGTIGILGHTMDDAEDRLRDNLDGLAWLLARLDGKAAGPRPTPRTPVPPRPATGTTPGGPGPDPGRVASLIAEARATGDPARGAEVFASTRFACLTCHRVGAEGGAIGPDLSGAGVCSTPEFLVESLLWPAREVRAGYEALAVETRDGRAFQGLKLAETPEGWTLREPATGQTIHLARADVESAREGGSVMPEGLLDAMTGAERRDLVRFLIDLGRPNGATVRPGAGHAHVATAFAYDRAPLVPADWPGWKLPVNRDRVYDFYAKEADHFAATHPVPALLPAYPGLDGGALGHWGNQSETTWVDPRWNDADLGRVLAGVFRGAGVTVPKAVCVRLGDKGDLSTCFNPATLTYDALWSDGFVKFAPIRHGFVDGLLINGEPRPWPDGKSPEQPFTYRGYYRHGDRLIFAYRVGEAETLDAPWSESGRFTRVVGPAAGHPLKGLTRGGPARWPEVIETPITRGSGRPYAVDTIGVPFANPSKSPLFFGDHDFLPDGSAFLCTIQGDVWRVSGLDGPTARWRRFASGFHQALGLVVVDGLACVLGRDQITRLHDLDGDGEADFYECVSNAFVTSTAGHDFTCGLQRDGSGNFYTVSGKQGLIKVAPDGATVTVLATGLRNSDGVGLSPTGVLTVPSSEGEWTPASMICEVRPGNHYGYGGPRDGKAPSLPLLYLPRGLDNSSGGQVTVPDDRWGPLKGGLIHFSFGSGSHFLILRDEVDGQAQGAAVPLVGEFRSGVHRGRFSPTDGQLYVSGMGGWGSYTPDDGCFERVRYTGDPVMLPVGFHAVENGLTVRFSGPVDPAVAGRPESYFAQAWNYRYAAAYGSPDLSPSHPGTPGHDPVAIRSATVLPDGRSVFLEMPEIQPVSQLQVRMGVDGGRRLDLFATIHRLDAPFTEIPGYRPTTKTIAVHPILADMAMAAKIVPNRWRKKIPGARPILIEAGKNLTFAPNAFTVKAGEPIELTFVNPDVVPHNLALIRPGSLARVGDLANKIIADPDAFARQYVPTSPDVIAYTDIVAPGERATISLKAPDAPGRYPFLCTFPGHWMVMNGLMTIERGD